MEDGVWRVWRKMGRDKNWRRMGRDEGVLGEVQGEGETDETWTE